MTATARHWQATGSPPTLHLALELGKLHGLRLELGPDFPERLEEARLWDGEPVPPELRARLKREWERRERVSGEIRALDAEREERLREAEGDPALEQVRQLMQLKGIGLRSAWLFVMEFFAWRDFTNGKEIGALSGLVDAPNQSGTSLRGRGMEKAGNARVRTMAIQIAWNWLRYQPRSRITRWYEERYADAGPGGPEVWDRRCRAAAADRAVAIPGTRSGPRGRSSQRLRRRRRTALR